MAMHRIEPMTLVVPISKFRVAEGDVQCSVVLCVKTPLPKF